MNEQECLKQLKDLINLAEDNDFEGFDFDMLRDFIEKQLWH